MSDCVWVSPGKALTDMGDGVPLRVYAPLLFGVPENAQAIGTKTLARMDVTTVVSDDGIEIVPGPVEWVASLTEKML